jgi:hypothetical protein
MAVGLGATPVQGGLTSEPLLTKSTILLILDRIRKMEYVPR